MVYRSDTEALEARLEVLEKDLAERTRERDDVAKLLTDAKAADEAQQWLADAPRRRRRRRWMIAGIALLLAGFVGFAAYQRTPPRPDRFEQTLEALAQYTDETCACADKACAQAVTDKLTKWAQEMAKDRETHRLSEAQMERMTEVTKRFSNCLMRAMQNDPSQGPQNQLAK